MSFALCVPDGLLLILDVLLVLVPGSICLMAAFLATVGLAKLAAAWHNRLAANNAGR